MAGHSVFALSAFDLARWPTKVLNEPMRADATLKRLAVVEILYLDDPFKPRLTPSVEEMLFVALDERTSRRRPTIFSFNDSASTLLAGAMQLKAWGAQPPRLPNSGARGQTKRCGRSDVSRQPRGRGWRRPGRARYPIPTASFRPRATEHRPGESLPPPHP